MYNLCNFRSDLLRVEPRSLIDVGVLGVEPVRLDVESAEPDGAGAGRRDAVDHRRIGVAQADGPVLRADPHVR